MRNLKMACRSRHFLITRKSCIPFYPQGFLNAFAPIKSMKAIKIIFAVLAALWALALIPKLLAGLTQSSGAYAFSHVMGSVVGILLASAISIALFRSAFRK